MVAIAERLCNACRNGLWQCMLLPITLIANSGCSFHCAASSGCSPQFPQIAAACQWGVRTMLRQSAISVHICAYIETCSVCRRCCQLRRVPIGRCSPMHCQLAYKARNAHSDPTVANLQSLVIKSSGSNMDTGGQLSPWPGCTPERRQRRLTVSLRPVAPAADSCPQPGPLLSHLTRCPSDALRPHTCQRPPAVNGRGLASSATARLRPSTSAYAKPLWLNPSVSGAIPQAASKKGLASSSTARGRPSTSALINSHPARCPWSSNSTGASHPASCAA